MQKITMFHFEACPYCRQARYFMRQLMAEHPEYQKLEIEFVDEKRNPVYADKYDYWYVPSFFVNGEKLHEGAAAREDVERVLQKAFNS